MNPSWSRSGAGPDSEGLDRSGSVRRAREMLEAGRRPKIRVPQAQVNAPPPRMDSSSINQWPLQNDHRQTNFIDPLLITKGLPPQRPPRPDLPSPSVYSERSLSESAPSPLQVARTPPSFSQPFPAQQAPYPPSREPVVRESVDMFRKSGASSISVPSISDFPQPAPPVPSKKMQNLAPPPTAMRQIMNRRSSVSPIPEELPDSPTIMNKPYAPSQITASSWNSEKAESDILGTYLDVDSDEMQESKSSAEDVNGALVRQASLGKRGKPSLRTIHKPTSGDATKLSAARAEIPRPALKETALDMNSRDSFSSDESCTDMEKAHVMLEHPAQSRGLDNGMAALEKEMEMLPKGTPTMSEIRPGARRPPRLNMSAVRDAEARGSLTSLSDLIKRATRLATNLEHGRTASRNDLLNMGGGSKLPNNRRSGSIQDILASFPPPAATPEGRSSWPFFFRKSTLHHLDSQEMEPEAGQEKGEPRKRRCCGIPLWAVIALSVLFIIIVAVAVLVPIFLVVVPREKADSNSGISESSLCEKTTPCANGGVSVSSGDVCSCVCANGFTGSQCKTAGDASCITTEITQGSISKNATIGTEIPRLFEDSQNNFSIPLDPITIMALFSQNNVSCTTENALVSFKDVNSSNKRRSLPLDSLITDGLMSDIGQPPAPVMLDIPTRTIAARNTVATKNGIVYEEQPTATAMATATPSKTSDPQETAQPSATATSVASQVVDFSRIAVLYIFEKTGTLEAAMFSADNIETYLTGSYASSKSGTHVVNLSSVGIRGNFTLNFDDFTITSYNGQIVGGES